MTEPHLIAEATRRSGLVWISVDGARAEPVWHLWREGAAYVLAGGGEQPATGLAEAERAAVTVPSKTTRGRLVTWRASVRRVPPDSDEWNAVVPELLAKRLNAPDGQQAPRRWARDSVLLRLDPTGEPLESPGSMPQDSGAAPPPPTPATTSGPLPYMFGRRRR